MIFFPSNIFHPMNESLFKINVATLICRGCRPAEQQQSTASNSSLQQLNEAICLFGKSSISHWRVLHWVIEATRFDLRRFGCFVDYHIIQWDHYSVPWRQRFQDDFYTVASWMQRAPRSLAFCDDSSVTVQKNYILLQTILRFIQRTYYIILV